MSSSSTQEPSGDELARSRLDLPGLKELGDPIRLPIIHRQIIKSLAAFSRNGGFDLFRARREAAAEGLGSHVEAITGVIGQLYPWPPQQECYTHV